MSKQVKANGKPRRDRGEVLDSMPPNALDSERALLSGVLYLGSIDQDIIIPPHEFYDPKNQAIWETLVKLNGEGLKIDPAAYRTELKKHRRWGQDGLDDVYAIIDIGTEGGSVTRQAWHAEQIHAAYIKRTASNYAELLLQKTRGKCDLEELAEDCTHLADLFSTNGTTKGVDYDLITASECLRRNYPLEFLIKGVLAKGEPALIVAPLKACKTLTAADMAIALVTGGYFLGYFPVPRPVRTIMLWGESGKRGMQTNLRRISRAAGATEADLDNLFVGVNLPKFGSPEHARALDKEIKRTGAEVVIIDCLYLCGVSGDIGKNQLDMGTLLASVKQVFVENDCTLVLLHHTTKHVPPGEPLQLDNAAFAGVAEFAAQWLLINRQWPYVPGSGHHDLLLTISGRAGHGGLYGVTIDEGPFVEGQDREWNVQVKTPGEMRNGHQEQREAEKQAANTQRLETDRAKVAGAMAKFPGGETKAILKQYSGLKTVPFEAALTAMLNDGGAVPCEVQKPNRKKPYPAFKLVEENNP